MGVKWESEISYMVVGKSLSNESMFLCGVKPASQRSGGTAFQAERATGAKALGKKHVPSRPLWLENSSRVESGRKQKAVRAPWWGLGGCGGEPGLCSRYSRKSLKFREGRFTGLVLAALWSMHCRGARVEVRVPL